MKTLLPLFILLLSIPAQSQSVFSNYVFSGQSGYYSTNITVEVPANTLFDIWSKYDGELARITGGGTVSNAVLGTLRFDYLSYGTSVIGPATALIDVQVDENWRDTNSVVPVKCAILARFQPVNCTPGNIGAVHLPNTTATAVLQSSSDLKQWENRASVTNTTGAAYEFYRVKLE
jgi:hypothetical protein